MLRLLCEYFAVLLLKRQKFTITTRKQLAYLSYKRTLDPLKEEKKKRIFSMTKYDVFK